MNILHALVLGLLQGLSEFLPISSSAHLTLAPWLFGWEDPGLAFDVALHLGTIVAVVWYFRREWVALVRAALRIVAQRGVRTPEERRVVFLALATIPGGIGGLLLADYASSIFRSPELIAIALIVMGMLLWLVDRLVSSRRTLDQMTWVDALLVGTAQVFALIPGVSRSGSTITAGRGLGLDRESAAKFSFLMSLPITTAAAIHEVPKALQQTGGITAPLVVGVLASAVSGWLAISVLLRYVSKHNFAVFAVYRLVLGVIVLSIAAARG